MNQPCWTDLDMPYTRPGPVYLLLLAQSSISFRYHTDICRQLRSLLGVPTGQEVLFERFSDSAGAFIELDSNNPQVWKQLHRAAKAKLRLRIRATYLSGDGRKPQLAAAESTPTLAMDPVIALSNNAPSTVTAPPAPSSPPASEPRIQLPSRQKPVQVHTAPASNPSLLDMDVPMGRSAISPPPKMPEMQRRPYIQKFQGSSVRVCPRLENLVDGFGCQDRHDEAPVPAEFSEHTNGDILWSHYYDVPYLPLTRPPGTPGQSFSICCNKCDASIRGPHWHCSICDNGDFDLCQSCFDQGIRCDNLDTVNDHWLIQRSIKNGKVVTSDTERYTPKKISEAEIKEAEIKASVPGAFAQEVKVEPCSVPAEPSRTCNACIGVFNETNFVTCTKCEDYDLCIPCHKSLKHGHHPGHPFVPASDDATMDEHALNLCAPGRHTQHRAVCDGCDKVNSLHPFAYLIMLNLIGYSWYPPQVFDLPRLGLLLDLCFQ